MPKFKRTKLACYSAYFTMASIFGLPPVLLVPLHELYRISYTLLGTLVLVNFFTQMAIDLALLHRLYPHRRVYLYALPGDADRYGRKY